MIERPPRATITVVRAFKACDAIRWGTKAVWIEDWILDAGPEASWISATNLAQRLGLSKESIEAHRRWLKGLAFYFVVERRGARSNGWVPTVPAFLAPRGTTVEAVNASAARIAAYVRGELGDIGSGGDPTTKRGVPGPTTSGVGGSTRRGVAANATSKEGSVREGVGGASLSQHSGEAQLFVSPADHETSGRVGASAPEAEQEEARTLEQRREVWRQARKAAG